MASVGHNLALLNEMGLEQKLSPVQVKYAQMLEKTVEAIEDDIKRELNDNEALAEADDDYVGESRIDGVPRERLGIGGSWHRGGDMDIEPQIADTHESLISELESQLYEQNLTDTQLQIAKYIIGNLDSAGYLRRDVNAISDDLLINSDIDVTADEVRRVLNVVQSLDPAGIGASDLRECMLLQLQRKGPEYDVAREIIRDYFDLFEKKHFDTIIKKMGISSEELEDAMMRINRLNPKPGGQYSGGRSSTIIPDFKVDVDADERITLTLLNNIPALVISESFNIDDSKKHGGSQLDREWIRNRRNKAEEYIQILLQRQVTLYKVMQAIVNHQKAFFLSDDPSDMRPMIIADITEATGFDKSVISRSTAGKYVQTDSGIYPLKYFFNERTQAGDDDTSRHKILEVLKSVIEKEDPRKPLSDKALMEALEQQGLKVARRTVAKYRESLGIPDSRLRKQRL